MDDAAAQTFLTLTETRWLYRRQVQKENFVAMCRPGLLVVLPVIALAAAPVEVATLAQLMLSATGLTP